MSRRPPRRVFGTGMSRKSKEHNTRRQERPASSNAGRSTYFGAVLCQSRINLCRRREKFLCPSGGRRGKREGGGRRTGDWGNAAQDGAQHGVQGNGRQKMPRPFGARHSAAARQHAKKPGAQRLRANEIKIRGRRYCTDPLSGGEYRTRTCDPLHVKQML